MIQLCNLYKNYLTRRGPIAALHDINLTIQTGEIYGIIGKSGAGKSSLIRCVNLLEKPSSGHVIIDGIDLTTLSPTALREERQKIGMIFQHFNLLASRTVYDNIAFPLELSGHSSKEIEKTITPLLELTGLSQKKHAYPTQLSGGQKQRVAIARALASKPTVLLSDEATSALDPETTSAILQLLKNIRDEFHLTILLITHEMSVIKAVADRVGILDHGKLIEEQAVGAFFANPKTAIAKKFITASLSQHLPNHLAKNLLAEEAPQTVPILRFWFFNETATKPIISELTQQFNLRINILQGNVETIQNHTMGIMVLALQGSSENFSAAVTYLKNIGVNTEVLGYVPTNILSFN